MKIPVLRPETAALLAAEMTTAFYVAKLIAVQQYAANPDVPMPNDAEIMRDVTTTFERIVDALPAI